MKQGTIVSHLGVKVLVQDEHGQRIMVHVARKSGHVVGDEIEIEGERLQRIPRRNALERKTPFGNQILAANLDAVGIVTCVTPPTPRTFLDHAIVACRVAGILPFIIVNKADLPESEAYLLRLFETFAKTTLVLAVSCKSQEGMAQLCSYLAERGRSALIGVSGVGKSSLMNTLSPQANLEVGALLDNRKHGRHVTTVSTLAHLAHGGELVDTPGVRDFSPVDLLPQQFAKNFVGFEEALAEPCRFRNCLHLNEPACVILRAVKEGRVAVERYDTYVEIMRKSQSEQLVDKP